MTGFKVFLIGLLFPFLTLGQNSLPTYRYTDGNTNYEFLYSPCLKGQLDEFFNHKELKGIDLSELSNLRAVIHYQIYGYYQGAYGLNTKLPDGSRVIIINASIPEYLPTVLSAVLYHEMGHQFLPTCDHCYGRYCPMIVKSGTGVSIEEILAAFTPTMKKRFFSYVKNKQMTIEFNKKSNEIKKDINTSVKDFFKLLILYYL